MAFKSTDGDISPIPCIEQGLPLVIGKGRYDDLILAATSFNREGGGSSNGRDNGEGTCRRRIEIEHLIKRPCGEGNRQYHRNISETCHPDFGHHPIDGDPDILLHIDDLLLNVKGLLLTYERPIEAGDEKTTDNQSNQQFNQC